MATVTTNNDGKILGGYLKEKLTIALTRINDDELTRAVTKVCSHKLKIPNEKHMQRLLQASFGSYAHADNSKGDISRWIVDNLEEHLHAHNWVVVLKTQLAFHRLMQDGSDDINIRIQSRRNLFAVSRTKDLADSPDGAVQSIFVQQYMRYLEERAIAQDSVRLGVRLENRAFGDTLLGLEPRKAVQATAAFLLQFEVAADVQFFEEAVNNYATLLGHQNVLNDAKLLFVALSRSILRVVQMAPTLSADERDTWRPLIKRYNAITGKFVAKLEKMRSSRVSWGEPLPALQVLPADAIASVLAALDGASAPSPAASPMGSPDAMPTVKLSDLMQRAAAAGVSAGTMSSASMPEDEDAELAAAIRASLEEQEQRQKQEELLRKYNGTANPAEAAAAAAAASATSPSIAAPAAAASAPAPAAVTPPAPAPKKTGLDDLFGPTSPPPPAATPSYGASVPSTSASASVDLFGAGPRPGAPAPAASGSVDLFAPKPSVVSPPPAAPIAAPATDLFAAPAHAPAAAPATDVFANFSAPAPAPAAHAHAPAPAPAAAPKPADPFAGAFANVAVASPAFSNASSSSAGVVTPAASAAAAAPAASQPSLFGAAAPASTTSTSAPAAPAAAPYPDLFGSTKQRDDNFQATLDFFAPPSSQPAPAPKQETFDPFGNTDANGRQRAW